MKLWEPSREQIDRAHVTRLMKAVSKQHHINFDNYHAFHQWSVNFPEQFWEAVWDYCKVKASVSYDRIVDEKQCVPGVKWFSGARLNFAENLLRFSDSRDAIVFWNEEGRKASYSYNELQIEVTALSKALRSLGLTKGDRVAALLPNIPHAIFGMLASTACGAMWSSCSPDFSSQGVLDRFSQIAPKVLFCCESYLYKGQRIEMREKMEALAKKLPSLEKVIIVPYLDESNDKSRLPKGISYNDFLAPHRNDLGTLSFEQVEPDHPVYILFSSGTTGAPKCIVHSVAGILLEHLKELTFEINLNREDRIFYNTTCGWMMWNWLASSLALGSTMLLYDGFPLTGEGNILFDLIENEHMTVFGTSAGFLQKIEEMVMEPRKTHDLSSLRAIFSTGSRLKPHSFDYVYRAIGDVQLSPIWGGTDLCGCLGSGSPVLAVHRDELQTRGLGLAVDVVDHDGRSLKGVPGEVVVRAPFPSMPVSFLNDPDQKRFRSSYFERFPGMWHHGDWAILTEHNGMIILGRSDDTLNPGGIRIGSAEVTSAAERVSGVIEGMAVAQQWGDDERIILFLVLDSGVILDDTLKKLISDQMPSPRHRPKKIIAVNEFPTTLNGKRSARAVRDVIHGRAVPNSEALINPQSLEAFRNIAELME